MFIFNYMQNATNANKMKILFLSPFGLLIYCSSLDLNFNKAPFGICWQPCTALQFFSLAFKSMYVYNLCYKHESPLTSGRKYETSSSKEKYYPCIKQINTKRVIYSELHHYRSRQILTTVCQGSDKINIIKTNQTKPPKAEYSLIQFQSKIHI